MSSAGLAFVNGSVYTVDAARTRASAVGIRDGRIVAVGTTTVRVLETVWAGPERGPLEGRTRLMIVPGRPIAATGALVTNFHLPRSTLLALVMAFAGVEETRALYRAAIEERYRFYSFGDAMLVM